MSAEIGWPCRIMSEGAMIGIGMGSVTCNVVEFGRGLGTIMSVSRYRLGFNENNPYNEKFTERVR